MSENSGENYSDNFAEPESTKRNLRPRRNANNNVIEETADETKFKFVCYVTETYSKPIFDVQFNTILRNEEPIFASVAGHRVSIYKCVKGGKIQLLQCFADPNSTEEFRTCAWSQDISPDLVILAAAGLHGIIRIFSPNERLCIKDILGHTGAINEIRFHPKISFLLASASKDLTVRLWNIKEAVCIAIFGGVRGHRDEVVSVDFDFDGDRLMSSGMDHSLIMWKLDKPAIKLGIERSKTRRNVIFTEHFYDYCTRGIHDKHVDCVRWYGDLLLSKSYDGKIILWKMGSTDAEPLRRDHSAFALHSFPYNFGLPKMFVRFSLDLRFRYMVTGSAAGEVFVWDLDTEDVKKVSRFTLTHPKCTSVVRQTSLSRNCDVLIAVCDDGTIWRWDQA